KGSGGTFGVRVDAETGEIVYMSAYKPETRLQGKGFTLSPTQAQEIANQFLKGLIPDRVDFLKGMPDSQLINLSKYEPTTYLARYQRWENQIPVEGDGATVEVSLADGKVCRYVLNWSKLSLPNPEGIITQEAAEKAFKDAEMLELQYLLNTGVRPLAEERKDTPVALVYRMTHESGGVIDAVSGQPWKNEAGYWLMKRAAEDMAGGTAPAGEGAIQLTPEEEREVGKVAYLLTQEEAITAVQKWVKPPQSSELRSANLQKDWQDQNLRIWNLHWSSSVSKNDDFSYLSARVNAVTGEILSFNLGYPRKEQGKYSMSRETARQIAENFLKQIQPERFNQVSFEVDEQDPVLLAAYDGPVWGLQWTRLVNGIKCPNNGLSVSIDRKTRQIISFSMNWADKEFIKPDKIMDMTAAEQSFLNNTPLTLVYTPVTDGEITVSYKLVYKPEDLEGRTISGILDAFSGEPLDWQGQPLAKQPRGYTFDDISGHFAEKEISLLGKAGFMGEYGNAFHPGEKITAASLFRALIGVRNGLYSVQEYSDEEVLMQAVNLGWLEESVSKGDPVSRELLTKVAIRYLGLEYLAQVPGIYRYPYQDKVSPNIEGYATLCWGLGIIKGDGKYFNPDHLISRGEAAMIITRLYSQGQR
ncbi:MAG: hypothetical protein GX550_02880, partial [Syntrophomonadaceae bacterium]|nr:hypothetical protein [Syntrophomonadaceae bacterium]